MLSLNIVNIDVRWRQYCRTLAVGNKIISSEKNAQPHLKNGFRNARGNINWCSSLISITSLSVTCCYGVEQTSFYWINLIQTCSQPSLLWGFLAFRFPDELLSSKDHVFTFKVFKHVGLLLYWRIVKRGCSIVASGIQNHSIVHRDGTSLNY